MPINIPDNLPASRILQEENIFVMNKSRAKSQDIRPMYIVIVNLMPLKIETETHLMRLLSNTPLQIDVTLIRPKTHTSKNTPKEHLEEFYKTFDDIKDKKFDGMIITGAPIEKLEFEEVNYWNEIRKLMEWSKTNVTSTFHICWGAQAGLYYHYGIKKHKLDKKMFGVFKHNLEVTLEPLVRGFDSSFYAPHSRHTTVLREDIAKNNELQIIAISKEAGVYIVMSKDRKNIFVTGHSEYDVNTLKKEYFRDKTRGLDIDIPKNYFEDDDDTKDPIVTWKSHANLLFANWINYYVYQKTPYNIGR